MDIFLIEEYDKQTRPIVFKLTGKMKLPAEYYENAMNEINLQRYEQESEKAQETTDLHVMHSAFARHLSRVIANFKAATKKGKDVVPVPCATEDERFEFLRKLSFQDLRSMMGQISEDLGRPLEEEEKNLSDGLPQKEESETAQEMKTAS